ncbi:DUF1876 domain-containing protein [Mycolicibacterium sp. CH28]|uniref:dsRBD fold-containing protein n=1 Tax=Mycolicibacterium sp. CH28 TaxID=2512237 RepID=UPI001081B2EC|nr:dsRBD fold-containing protein [Mycolicibacterium sp. CH28]TGD87941.1 DUF1876 domain-containing protein [Mycolicibacterium sp. CH28]
MEHHEIKHSAVLMAVDGEADLTQATARLCWDGTTLEGIGRARMSTDDAHAVELRDKLAVARALSNLANQLFATSMSEMETVVLHRPLLTALPGGRR